MKVLRLILSCQAVYYLLTAVWPLLHIESFLEVTGPKTDLWLVKTVSVLLLAIGLSFISSLLAAGNIPIPVTVLAVACCIVLAAIDFYYASRNVISDIYMLDGIAELVLLAAWAVGLMMHRRKQKPSKM